MIIEFSAFLILQSLFINGVKYCFEKDGIFFRIAPDFFERNKGKTWTINLWGCIKCMSSTYGTITFWIAALIIYGYHWQEFPLWIFDIFALIPINWMIFKKM